MLNLLRGFAYAATTYQPPVGIVGGGMAGVTAARHLASQGVPVTLFERSDSLGGRMGAVPLQLLDSDTTLSVGVGCSYIKGDEEDFNAQLEAWADAGSLARWDGKPHTIEAGSGLLTPIPTKEGEQWFCGMPSMSSMLELDDEPLVDVRLSASVTSARWADGAWTAE